MKATRTGAVCEVARGKSRCYGESDGIPPYNFRNLGLLSEDGAGNFWLGGDTGFAKWRPSLSAAETFKLPGIAARASGVRQIISAPDDSQWIGVEVPGRGLGLQHLVHGVLGAFKTADWDSSSVGVTALLLDQHNALWVGTWTDGLYRIHDGKVDHFGSADGLTGDFVRSLFEDHEGDIWVTTARGVDSFRDLAVVTFSAHEGLKVDESDTVVALRNGTVLTGGGGSLDSLREGRVSSLRKGKGLPGQQITSLMEDRDGQLWVGIDQTMSILKDGRFKEIKRPDGRPIGFVVGMAQDVENDIWLEISASPRELVRIRNLEVREILPASQVPAGRKVAADPQGGIWIGLMNGDLARYRQGQVDLFHYPHKSDTLVNEIRVASDGTVLAATASGLLGWRKGAQQVLTTHNGLPCDGINSFISDNFGALWLYTQCGLIQISAQEYEKWWGHPGTTLQMRIFDSADGVLPGLASFQGAARAADGKLWFANGAVLQMIDPNGLSVNLLPPPVHVEEVVVDHRTIIPDAADLRLPAYTRDLAIHYTALSFVAPQKVAFRYMLDGQDRSWQDAGTRREAFYTNLAPGSYRFHVIACNNDGSWNESGATFSFSIAPAYYQTKWFASICVLTIAVMLWLLYLLRLKQARIQIEQRLGARLEERERISRELHDTLLQGFQGLILRFQAVMKLLPHNEPGRQMMDKVLDQADQVLLEGRQSVRGLRSDAEFRGELSEALARCGRELAETSTSAFSVVVSGTPRTLSPIVFEEVYRIVREALFNAFQHSRASKIELEVIYSIRRASLRVRDNGAGMDPEILNSGRPGHWGLSGMRERAQKIGAKLKISSRRGAGTEIEVVIPIKALSPINRMRALWRQLTLGNKTSAEL